ncbi:subtilisin-like proprotein convertase family protein [Saonia flava]|uniref:Subtilisin-like proprotein convertase family protein n=1 Tax=Saonia flava TaxID=523696 RepID=A0A846QUU4_9FLAO|nr:zinc-dependent metalloprotease family protein [Saonia flava]NJB71798.1 subtilisin-like proprotein convertase family protein [Saonia flava]
MLTKLRLVFSISITFLCFYGSAQTKYWEEGNPKTVRLTRSLENLDVDKTKLFTLKSDVFKNELAPISANKNVAKVVYFPNEKGNYIPFKVKEKPILSNKLALKYPEIKSYSGYGLEDKNKRIRFSVSQNGVQSMILQAGNNRATFMQKAVKGDDKYVVYTRDANLSSKDGFICDTQAKIQESVDQLPFSLVDDKILRKYRIAVSATGEYTQYHGGTVADALAAINATLTRVNEVFETDLGVTLELVANNDLVIFTDAVTDPYNGNLNSETQNTLTSLIGEENYDVGHLFHNDDNNGNAGFVGSVCVTNRKGSAFSSGLDPEGDLFDLDFVSHELGHQFGANHTWSFESEGTLVQAEPASGTTIMGYAGIVQGNNVAPNGDDYFHYYSILQISEYLETTSCGEQIAMTNNPPSLFPVGDFTIPKSTAFVLTGNASDSDLGDILTYTWEQIDDGVVTSTTFGPNNPSGANFRSQKPHIEPERYFPKLSSVILGNLTQTNPTEGSAWETVSNVEREMNFALTVRDNAIGGGQVISDLVKVNVVNAAGPFLITSQESNEIYTAGSTEEVTWDVANTNGPLVNAQMVDIFLSTNGGVSFPIQLANDVPNDGQQSILLPGVATTSARLMIRASNNIFFAVNTSNFTITSSEVVLAFDGLEYGVCQPADLVVPFDYQTFLGFSDEVTFSIPDAPAGLGVVFSPASATANTPVNITFSNTAGLAAGDYPVTVTATSIDMTKEVVLELGIGNNTFSVVTLSSPIDGMVDASQTQILQWEEVPNAANYDIEIATDDLFTNIVESNTVIFSSYEASNLEPETTYFWRVKPKNNCGEGVFSAPFSFTTVEISCTNLIANSVPLEISTVGTPTISSKITFLEDLPISDVNVNLDIEHSFLADLVVSLTSPSGTTVVLTSSSCGDRININATFDDDASPFVCGNNQVVDGIIQPSIGGIVKPLGSLSSFNGESTYGEWVLEIQDTAPSDGGFLNSFSLDICVEGAFRPDADEDGVYDDGDDLCLGTPKGAEVNVDGCAIYRFPTDNFLVSINSETCINSDNGIIEIVALDQTIDYTTTVTGGGINITGDFMDVYTLSNLASGIYSVCITGTDGIITYEAHCFEAIITQPDALSVTSKVSVDGRKALLALSGSSLFNIELNGLLIQTENKEIELDLKNGRNQLKVYTNLTCQGSFEEEYMVFDEPLVYPNPFVDSIKVFGGSGEHVAIDIFSLNGKHLRAENINIINGEIEIGLSEYPSGMYFVKVGSKEFKRVFKVIKR